MARRAWSGLMEMLNGLNKSKPSSIETHVRHPPHERRALPERRHRRRERPLPTPKACPLHRERYMDNTARLRAIKGAIEEMQKGDKAMGCQKFQPGRNPLPAALKQAPNDYAGLVSMAKCQLIQKNYAEGARYARQAQSVYPAGGPRSSLERVCRAESQGIRAPPSPISRPRSAFCRETPTPSSSSVIPMRAWAAARGRPRVPRYPAAGAPGPIRPARRPAAAGMGVCTLKSASDPYGGYRP